MPSVTEAPLSITQAAGEVRLCADQRASQELARKQNSRVLALLTSVIAFFVTALLAFLITLFLAFLLTLLVTLGVSFGISAVIGIFGGPGRWRRDCVIRRSRRVERLIGIRRVSVTRRIVRIRIIRIRARKEGLRKKEPIPIKEEPGRHVTSKSHVYCAPLKAGSEASTSA